MGDKAIEAGAWMLEHGHRALLTLSGGRFPKTVGGMQPVELTTIGRKTGLRRATLLTSPIYEEDRVVLVASKGGYSDNPIWYKNLVANPAVEIKVGDRTR
ncbi:MAG TPA: nitroreductase/quinone reductase family protein, partial [Acidimicrobiales bacterium]